MSYIYDKFGDGYSTINVKYDIEYHEISFTNDEYGYALNIQESDKLFMYLHKLQTFIDYKPYIKHTINLSDTYSFSIQYSDNRYVLHSFEREDRANYLQLDDDMYKMFLDKLDLTKLKNG